VALDAVGRQLRALRGGRLSLTPAATAPTLELLAWIASRPRTYAEAIEAWKSNCPRLSVWDDAIEDGLVQVARSPGDAGGAAVALTARGRALLSDA
jgi:hypothetical protein